jgi:hypothetical protein
VTQRLGVTVLTLCVISLTACNSGGGRDRTRAGTGSDELTPTVQSSLSGLSVLPDRISWRATTSLPPARVREVRFYVGGHRWWVDRTPPYTYGPEGALLPVRFISSVSDAGDVVNFRVTVISTDGKRWSTISRAETPEASLARNAPGNFGRHGRFAYVLLFGRVSAPDLANPPPMEGDLFASFTGWLAFVRAGLFTGTRDGKRQFAWEMASDGKRISLGTPIYLDARGGPASFVGYRTLRTALCGPETTPATYSWSVRQGPRPGGDYVPYLELRPMNEPCETRRKMLEGVWYAIQD